MYSVVMFQIILHSSIAFVMAFFVCFLYYFG